MAEGVGSKKTVLLVDDEPGILRFLSIKLRISGYEVVTASSGEKALELVEPTKPDIMLLDIIMPGIDGLQVLRKLRAFSSVPVIAVSARRDAAQKAMTMGASDYLVKPFNPDELVGKIKTIVGKEQ